MPTRAGHPQWPVTRRFKIVICRGPECGDRHGSAMLYDVFRTALESYGAAEHTELAWQSCFGRCTQGPNVLVREILSGEAAPSLGSGFATLPGPRGATALYNRMDTARVAHVVAEHVVGGRIVRDYIERPGIHPSDAPRAAAPQVPQAPIAVRTKDS
jgi:(2Fe-2S) ferredoxin